MQLIAISQSTIGGETIQTVNARDLHAFLEVGKDFSNGIKDRIASYDFKEGQDFVKTQDLRSPNWASAKSRAQVAIDYHISLDMAKELSMVERNAKGKEARQYFLDCERRAKAAPAFAVPQTMSEALRLAADLSDQNTALTAKVAEMAPDVAALRCIAIADGSLCITDAAKTLQMRPKDLFAYLRNHRWIYSRYGGVEIAYQEKIIAGLLEHKTTTVERSDGTSKVATQVRVTPSGLARLGRELAPVLL